MVAAWRARRDRTHAGRRDLRGRLAGQAHVQHALGRPVHRLPSAGARGHGRPAVRRPVRRPRRVAGPLPGDRAPGARTRHVQRGRRDDHAGRGLRDPARQAAGRAAHGRADPAQGNGPAAHDADRRRRRVHRRPRRRRLRARPEHEHHRGSGRRRGDERLRRRAGARGGNRLRGGARPPPRHHRGGDGAHPRGQRRGDRPAAREHRAPTDQPRTARGVRSVDRDPGRRRITVGLRKPATPKLQP